MVLNPFFQQGSTSEQNLVQSLINEQLQIYGVNVHYMPRKYANSNTIIKEVIESKFGLGRFTDKEKIVAIQKELRDNKVAVCTQEGYDEYYILPRGERVDSEGELEFKENMRAAGMAREFMKHTSKRTLNRQLLNKFIQKVA